ncbi:MAG: hypothetical protein H7X83_01140 [Verrucomicrobia bacterium]|nr:hypothetical protein [Deltaproteobacteria bacterium]
MDAILKIGDGERKLFEADEHWIIDQINQRKRDSLLICIQVLIDFGGRKMRLTTPTCAGTGGGGLAPTSQEKQIFDLWDKMGMNTNDFNAGKLIAFRSHLKKIL